MSAAKTVKAWLSLTRASNTPTVITNAIAGAAIALYAVPGIPIDQPALLKSSLALVLAYWFGMILNDLSGRAFDKEHQPWRPLITGDISTTAARIAASITLLGAILLTPEPALAPMLALIACIVLYDTLHKRTGLAVLAMGLCRAGCYWVGFSAIAGTPWEFLPLLILAAVTITLYTAAFTVIAKSESTPDRRPFTHPPLAFFVPLIAVAGVLTAMILTGAINGPKLYIVGAIILLAVAALSGNVALMHKRKGVRDAVMAWIAAMCIIDAAICIATGSADLAKLCVLLFLATALSQKAVLGS